MDMVKEYASNLSAEQWRLIEKLLPKPKKLGRKPIDKIKSLKPLVLDDNSLARTVRKLHNERT